jgi:NADH dehydrogenase
VQRIVIIGGGFGGLYAAKTLRRAEVQVTLIDRHNYHLFQPLLYQVATGGLSPADIASPLRQVLSRQANTSVLMGEVVDFDVAGQHVVLKSGQRVPYDKLIVAAGSRDSYFGHDEWSLIAPPLKSIEDATQMRRRILGAFEAAELEPPCQDRLCSWLRFVIVGGGPTGVELAGALAEIARDTLENNFRHIDPSQAQIILLDGGDRLLKAYPPELSEKARTTLMQKGVEVRLDARVTDIKPDHILVNGPEGPYRLETRTVLWAAGVQASPLGPKLAERTGCERTRSGQVIVEADCTIPGHPAIFVIGDLAHFQHGTEMPLPGVAQVAMQQGKYVAKTILTRERNRPVKPFVYNDLGNMAVIGRNAAVADLGWTQFSGFIAWLAWVFIHILNLIEFQNRVLVATQWAWSYFTENRSARLIVGEPYPVAAVNEELPWDVKSTAAKEAERQLKGESNGENGSRDKSESSAEAASHK